MHRVHACDELRIESPIRPALRSQLMQPVHRRDHRGQESRCLHAPRASAALPVGPPFGKMQLVHQDELRAPSTATSTPEAGQRLTDLAARQLGFAKTDTAFWPPKPKPLTMAARTSARRAWFGT